MISAFNTAPPTTWTSTLRWCPLWVALLLISLAFPSEFSFYIGSSRLSPHRVVLIISFVPTLIRLINGRAGPVTIVDLLIIIHVLWSYVVIGYHHGFSVSLESGGIRMLEVAGTYLIARVYITDERSFRGAVAVIFSIMAVLAPLLIIESATGFSVIKEVSSKITGNSFNKKMSPRLGLYRAYGPFGHPILQGVFTASALGLTQLSAWPRLGSPKPRYILPTLAVILAASSSLSSGALAALAVQAGLIMYEKKTRQVNGRWKILITAILIIYFSVDFLSNRSGFHVFLHYLTFSAHTAFNRMIIFQYGIQDIWQNPFLGIGFNTWSKPHWMHSDSMDNFWLVQAVTFGIPGFATIAIAILISISTKWKEMPTRLGRLRTGWVISVVGMIISACTVHFWNNLFAYFFFFIGAGGWFLQVRRTQTITINEHFQEHYA